MTKTVTLPLVWQKDEISNGYWLKIGSFTIAYVNNFATGYKFFGLHMLFSKSGYRHTLDEAKAAVEAEVLAMGVDPVAELSRTYQDKLIDAINDKRHFPEERAGFQMAAALFRSCLPLPPANAREGK